jgi:hypothetical protein
MRREIVALIENGGGADFTPVAREAQHCLAQDTRAPARWRRGARR